MGANSLSESFLSGFLLKITINLFYIVAPQRTKCGFLVAVIDVANAITSERWFGEGGLLWREKNPGAGLALWSCYLLAYSSSTG